MTARASAHGVDRNLNARSRWLGGISGLAFWTGAQASAGSAFAPAVALTLATLLAFQPTGALAQAVPGNGGNGGGGAVGGTSASNPASPNGDPGQAGVGTGGGGGGGAGQAGGQGGAGAGGAAGGAGGVVGGAGGNGAAGATPGAGGGGGGGGFGQVVLGAPNTTLGLSLPAGSAGAGGAGNGTGSGGGGGAGGTRALFSFNPGSTFTVGASISVFGSAGGAGGAGGAAGRGGDGGAGGAGVVLISPSTVTLQTGAALRGGAGGAGGGISFASTSAAGNGGAGGTALSIGGGAAASSYSIAATATVTGGAGGAQGPSLAGGAGGRGGDAVFVRNFTSGTTGTNAGTITGGAGGAGIPGTGGRGGDGVNQIAGSLTNGGTITGGAGANGVIASGAGGDGVVGSSLTVSNSGTIAGGAAGGVGAATGFALNFTGGTNSITQAGNLVGGVNVATGALLRLGSATPTALNNVISGGGSVGNNLGQTAILGGANTYTGGTNIVTGAVNIANDSALGTGVVSLSMGQLNALGSRTIANAINISSPIQFGSSINNGVAGNIFTLNGAMSGTGGVTFGGSGTTMIGATGGVTGADSAVVVANGTRLGLASGVTFSARTITVNSGATIDVGTNAVLRGTGNTTNIAGTVSLAAGGAIEDATAINFQTGAVLFTAGNARLLAPSITIASGTGIQLAGAGVIDLYGNVSGAGSIGFGAGGGVILNARGGTGVSSPPPTATGTQTIETGIGVGGAGEIRNSTGGSLFLRGVVAGIGAINFTSGGGAVTTILTANNSNSGVKTIGTNVTLQVGEGGTTGSLGGSNGVINNGTLVFNRSSAANETNIISGTGSLLHNGSGTTTLVRANTYTGVTNINNGTLVAVDANSLGSTANGTFVANGATLALRGTAGSTLTFAPEALTLSGTGVGGLGALRSDAGVGGTNIWQGNINLLPPSVRINSDVGTLILNGTISGTNAGLFVGGAGNTTINGSIATGNGGLTKDGTGTLTLGNSNNYSGLTSVNSGTLALTTSGLLTSNSVVLNGATMTNAGTIIGNIDNRGTFNSTGFINGILSNGGSLITGTLNPNAVANIRGTMDGSINNTATINITGVTNRIGAVTQTGGTFNLGGFSTAIGSFSGSGNITLGTGTLTTGGNNSSTSFSGVISGSGGLTKVGTGTFTLSGANSFTGQTNVNAGTLVLATGGSLAGAVSNSATFTNDGTVAGIVVNSNIFTSTGALNGGLSNSGNASVRGTLLGNVSNNGTLTLTGTTTGINALSQLATGTFNMSGFSTAIGSLSGAGTIALGSGTLTTGGSNVNTSFSGVISGAGGLTKTGTGTLTLSGANSYAGVTTVAQGTLAIANANALGSSAGGTTVANGATLRLQTSGGTNFFNPEALTLSGLGVGGLGALRSDAGTTGSNDWRGAITLAGDSRIASDAGILVLRQVVGGAFSLDLTGAGTISLLGTNGYTGLTTVNTTATATSGFRTTNFGTIVGDVRVNTNFGNQTNVGGGVILGRLFVSNAARATNFTGARIDGGVTVDAGGIFASAGIINGGLNNGGTVTVQNILSGAVNNSGLITLSGDTSGIGLLTQTATGIFDFAGFNASIGGFAGMGELRLGAGNLTLGGDNSSSVFGGTLSGTGSLIKQGTGTVTLNGPNGFTGGTTIAGGTLAFGDDGALGTGGVTLAGGTLAAVGNRTLANLITVNAPSTIANGGAGTTLTINQAIGGTSDLGFTGTGTTILGGGAAITGLATFANGLTLNIAANQRFSARSFDVQTGASVNLGAGAALLGTGNTMNIAGAVGLGAGGAIDDATAVNLLAGGTIAFAGAGRLLAPTINLAAGTTVSLNGPGLVDVYGNVTGTGSFVLGADGALLRAEGGAGVAPGPLGGGDQAIAAGIIVNAAGEIRNGTGGNLTLAGPLSGTGALTFSADNGSAGTILTGANTVAGRITVASGTLVAANANAIGASGATVVDGATLYLQGPGLGGFARFDFNGGPLSIAGNGVGGFGALRGDAGIVDGYISFGGAIDLAGDALITSERGFVEFTGAVTGAGRTLTIVDRADGLSFTTGIVADRLIASSQPVTGGIFLSGTSSFASGLTVQAGFLRNTGVINGNLTNAGTFVTEGALNGNVNNAGLFRAFDLQTTGIRRFSQTAAGVFDMRGFGNIAGSAQGVDFTIGSLDGAGSVILGAATLTTGGDGSNSAFSGVISGTGRLVKAGSGTFTLSGVNSYTGLTTVAGGTLELAAGGALAGGLVVNTGATGTNAGTIAGGVTNAGTFTSTGRLNGGLSNSGTARIAGQLNGVLIATGGTVTQTGSVTGITQVGLTAPAVWDIGGFATTIGSLAGIGTVRLGAATLTTGGDATNTRFDGGITGTGGLTKVGAGTFILGGANSFTGLTSVSAGALQLSAGASLAGAVTNSATFLNAGTVGGPLTNSGTATNSGILAGAVTNSATFLNTGTVAGSLNNTGTATNSGTLAGAVTNTATFQNTGLVGGLLTNSGTATNSGTLLGGVNNSRTFSSNGVIGTGLTNSGSASLAGQLNGFLNNAGAVTLLGGLTVTGAVSQTAPGTIDLAGANAIFGSLAGAGAVRLGAGALQVGGDGASTSFAGVISGAGSLIKTGAGTLTLTGVNTYTGTTFVNAGSLTLGTPSGSVGSSGSGVTLAAPVLVSQPAIVGTSRLDPGQSANEAIAATARIDGAAAGFAGGPASTNIGDAGSTANASVGSSAVTSQIESIAPTPFNVPPSNAVIAGTVQVANGATFNGFGTVGGGLIVLAGGTANNNGVINGGANNAGTLVSTNALNGGLANSGIARIAGQLAGDVVNSGSITLTGVTTGMGNFNQTAAGSLALGGFATTIGTISGAGRIDLGAGRLTTGVNGVNTLFAGTIVGTGALTKTGTGGLILSGDNSFTGGTIISSGTLQLGNGGTTGSLVGPVVNNAMLVVNRSNLLQLDSVMSGTGMFVQAGTGTTALTGANSYTGGTLISAGRLVGNTVSLQGAIQNNAALEFAQTGTGVFAGRIAGTGIFDKTGAGLLDLTGDNSGLTGASFVRGGELRVTGLLSRSVVTVQNGTSLSGTGVVGGLVAQAGSTIAPGSGGIGTLGVAGNVVFQSGSTFSAQVGATSSDIIVASGTAALGGTLAISGPATGYRFGSSLLLLQADQGRTGTFGTVTGLDGFSRMYRPEIFYLGTQVGLRFNPNLLGVLVAGQSFTPNQRSTVARFDAAVTGGYDPAPFTALYNLPTASIAGALDQLSGETRATSLRLALSDDRVVRDAVLTRLASVAGDSDEGRTGVWGQFLDSWGDVDADGNAASTSTDVRGLISGVDIGGGGDTLWRAGVMGFYLRNQFAIGARASNGTLERTGIGLYAQVESGPLALRMTGNYAKLELTTNRAPGFAGFADSLRSEGNGHALSGTTEIAWTADLGSMSLTPFLQGSATKVTLDAVTEIGGPAALRYARTRGEFGTATLGVRFQGGSEQFNLSGLLGARRAFGDRTAAAQAAFAAAPAASFTLLAPQTARMAADVQLNANLRVSEMAQFSVGYSGLLASDETRHAVKVAFTLEF